ncbi:MAG: bifunctional ornithine acetyltransferase/N-acetylglutamate synthase [Lachnospiraceae bacterium]|jgi:glutamate N-acetyltransferase/amino-acid acetyltransferase
MINIVEGGVTAAKGFNAAVHVSGIKRNGENDMALIQSVVPCSAAGFFSNSRVKSPSVKWNKKTLEAGAAVQAILVTSGNANACNGTEGDRNCKAAANAVATKLLISEESVMVASSGEIGVPLPMEKILNGIKILGDSMEHTNKAGTEVAGAIMTTNSGPKEIAFEFTLSDGTVCTIGGCAKGSSAARSDMSTMLVFLTTDINISPQLIQSALDVDVKYTYNMVARETGVSPNDSVILLANGMAGNEMITSNNEDYQLFREVLHEINIYFSKKIAVDNEYRMSLFNCVVSGAADSQTARFIARFVASSRQTRMLFQENSNEWGGVLAEVGTCGAEYNTDAVDMCLESREGSVEIVNKGKLLLYDRRKVSDVMAADELTLKINLNMGKAVAHSWGRGLYIIDVKA